MLLKDRVAIVTGGSSGIGRGICLEFAREGAGVVVSDINETPKQGKYHETEPSPPTADLILTEGGEALFVETDVASESDLKRLIHAAIARYGRLDILVNNAGILIEGGISELSSEDWDRVHAVNLKAAFLATRFALACLEDSPAGRIINVASVLAFGGGGGPAYAASKAGLVNLTRDTALDVGKSGITANVICPGYVETPIQDYLTPEDIEACRKKTSLDRFGQPRDIGRAAVFLASDDAQWITGTALTVDGGFSAGMF